LLAFVIFSLVLSACGANPTPTPAVQETAEAVPATEVAEETPAVGEDGVATGAALKMALLPVLDVLPFFIAQEQGYFTDEGLSVELIPVSSALEREQLMAASEVDGVLTDVIGPVITNAAESGPTVRIVAMARRAYANAPLFRLLAAPESGVASPADLAGRAIGISENSVIQYLADRLLAGAGLAVEDIVYESVPAIPTRFNLMMEGQLAASILPDPLAQAAIEAGAIPVIDDTALPDQEFSQSVLSFRNVVLVEKAEAVRAFLRAWNRAVEDLNADPNAYRQLWIENTSVPEAVRETYVIPPFPVNAITSEAAWNDVAAWLIERGIIETAPAYTDSVDASFLPEQ
jgi:NitT/TauT family transport system substrate-binding protein